MIRFRFLALVALLALPILGNACANASELADDDTGDDDITESDSGTDASTGRKDSGTASPPKGSSSGSGGSSGASSGGSSSGGSSSGGSSGGSSSGGSSSGGQPDVCTGATCAAAQDFGTTNGDTGSGTFTATGTQTKWITFFAKDSFSGGVNISWSMQFTPAAGIEYEVRVADSQTASCSTATTVIPASKYSSYESHWTDDVPASDDGHQVYLQIKQISGACPSAAWSLKVDFNTY